MGALILDQWIRKVSVFLKYFLKCAYILIIDNPWVRPFPNTLPPSFLVHILQLWVLKFITADYLTIEMGVVTLHLVDNGHATSLFALEIITTVLINWLQVTQGCFLEVLLTHSYHCDTQWWSILLVLAQSDLTWVSCSSHVLKPWFQP